MTSRDDANERRSSSQLEALFEASMTITAELAIERVLLRIVELSRSLVGAQYAALGVPGVIGGFLGLTVWNELEGSDGKVRTFAVAMLVLLLTGVVLSSLGPAAPK